MCQFLGFSGLDSENSLFYSVLRRPAMFEMAHHKPTKFLFLQYLKLVPAKFLGNKAFHICELHFALRFLSFFRKPKLPHRPWRYHPHIYIYIYIYMLLQRKKANSLVPAICFPIAWPFRKKGEGQVLVYIFLFPGKENPSRDVICPVFTRPFFLFAPFAGHSSSFPFSQHLFALVSPSKSALFCTAKGTAAELGELWDGPLHKVREGNSFPKSAWKKGQ